MVVICSKCGRGLLGKSRGARIDAQPVWWLVDPDDPNKMINGPKCNGTIVHVERNTQVNKVWADAIVPANEQEIL